MRIQVDDRRQVRIFENELCNLMVFFDYADSAARSSKALDCVISSDVEHSSGDALQRVRGTDLVNVYVTEFHNEQFDPDIAYSFTIRGTLVIEDTGIGYLIFNADLFVTMPADGTGRIVFRFIPSFTGALGFLNDVITNDPESVTASFEARLADEDGSYTVFLSPAASSD